MRAKSATGSIRFSIWIIARKLKNNESAPTSSGDGTLLPEPRKSRLKVAFAVST
jgi:hypothetical protein